MGGAASHPPPPPPLNPPLLQRIAMACALGMRGGVFFPSVAPMSHLKLRQTTGPEVHAGFGRKCTTLDVPIPAT